MDYVEKQIKSTGDHMDDRIKKRLEDIKTKLSLSSPENNIIPSSVGQMSKVGLFATALLVGAAIGTEIYKRYEM